MAPNSFHSDAVKAATRKRLFQYYNEGGTPEEDEKYTDDELATYALYLACPHQYRLFIEQGDHTRLPFPSGFPPINFPSSIGARIDQLATAVAYLMREMERQQKIRDAEKSSPRKRQIESPILEK